MEPAAKRELEEETGYSAPLSSFKKMGAAFPLPSLTEMPVHYVFVDNVVKMVTQQPLDDKTTGQPREILEQAQEKQEILEQECKQAPEEEHKQVPEQVQSQKQQVQVKEIIPNEPAAEQKGSENLHILLLSQEELENSIHQGPCDGNLLSGYLYSKLVAVSALSKFIKSA